MARCTVERLMTKLGLSGDHQGAAGPRFRIRPQPVSCRFSRFTSTQLGWVARFTYVDLGRVRLRAFVTDAYACRPAGGSLPMATPMVLDAIEQFHLLDPPTRRRTDLERRYPPYG